jgi:multidrug efflux pump subunit AcrA (membrane-fusion protein)
MRHPNVHCPPVAALLALAWVALVATSTARAQTPATSPAAPPTVAVPATIEAFWSADLYAKTSGYVADVKADIGDHVKKGDLLAVLRVPELDKNLLQANATLAARKQMLRAAEAATAQAKQALAVAKQQMASYKAEADFQQVTLKRQEELSAGNAATPQQLDEARSKAEVAKANLGIGEAKIGAAEADVRAAEANRDVAAAQVDVADAAAQEVQALLEYTRITAPFDAVVTRRQVAPGDLVQGAAASRTTPLFTVQQLDTVRVFCDVPELKAAGVAVGAPAEIKVYGLDGRVIAGKVTRVASSLAPATRTMRAEIDLKNSDEALRPGMYVQVTLTLRPPGKLADAAAKP